MRTLCECIPYSLSWNADILDFPTTALNLTSLLVHLAQNRPLFHSEADFQHAVAWEIHNRYPTGKVRLEYRPLGMDGRTYVDIWAVLEETAYALELKYKTRSLIHEHEGEVYQLLNQGAQDQGRYDFLKDVVRLEQLATTDPWVKGIALLLTNDSTYWQPPNSLDTVDAAFRIHEGCDICGRLEWGSRASAGTKHSRETPLDLLSSYNAEWVEYSHARDTRNGRFRYLLVHVTPKALLPEQSLV